jgi:hypothetical protein
MEKDHFDLIGIIHFYFLYRFVWSCYHINRTADQGNWYP